MCARTSGVKLRPKWLCALANTADGVFMADAEQRIFYWNHGAEKLLGYTPEEVCGRHCYEILGGRCDDRAHCLAGCTVYRGVERGILPDNFDLLSHTKEGKSIWLNVSTIALPGKKKPWIVHLLRDTGRQKENQDTVQNIRRILEHPSSPPRNGEESKAADRRVLHHDNQLAALTRREAEIFLLLADGLSTTVIAQRIGVSSFTIRNHIRNALRKLDLHSRAQAVSFAFAHGLIRAP